MPQVIQYGQEELYNTLFKPALVDIIQMQLTGLPVDMPAVAAARVALEADSNNARTTIANSVSVLECVDVLLKPAKAEAMNKKWKVKRITAAEVPFEFNPRSAPQIQQLLFKFYALPVLEKTDAGHPSTEGDVLKALMAHTNDPEILSVLQALVDFKAVDIILGTFIPALEGAVLGPDGWHYLYGNFNLGGTVSGRLSSSDPNLQNLPSTGSKYAKIIKTCIKAPPGWLFAGADFLSLEDRISALTTKDPNKQKVYLEGYDGHSLRAYSYYPEAFVGVPETVTAINAIAKTHPELRQSSKKPTFTLTYQGTYATLMRNCGFTEEKAREIEANYHKLYAHSDAWLQCKLDQAAVDGYVTLAFGLRLCTPLLHQVIRGTRKVPSEAAAEGRTAGNALGQSWGLLNTRAGLAFMRIVRQSKHRYDVRPCAHIHDAQYYLVRDCEETVLFTNTHLCGEMAWQDHPEIAHPDIPLGGELDIFYPNWASKITIPNGADAATLHKTISSTLAEWADTTKKAAR
jgi:DNA polymerase-1